MEAGVMEYDLKNQDLAPFIQTAIAEFELPAQEKQLQVRCSLPDKPVLAPCDGDRIIQVMSNLVGNAVKFSPAGSAIEIRVAHGSEDGSKVPSAWLKGSIERSEKRDYWIIEVADRGPGVPDTAKADIFERFRQVKSGAKASGQGTGLGLAICRTIVTAHGGMIWVDDNPGGGSCFRFVVPCLHEGDAGRYMESSPI
jgi:signal transduction histidine kinase